MTDDEFGDCLNDLIWSALLERMPARHIASALLKATSIIAAACEIDLDDLMADLNNFAVEMNSDWREHLH